MKQNRDIENGLVVTKEEVGGRGLDWDLGISRCRLVYIEGINNKALLYSTGSYIQYPVISHNRKNIKKNVYAYMYIYTWMYD